MNDTPAMFAILWSPGPAWEHGKPLSEQKLNDHRSYFESLTRVGLIEVAGPFLDEQVGGIAIIRTSDLVEAQKIMCNDPSVITCVFSAALRPFYCLLKG